MKDCDVYVQPSRYEGKAVTVTEAQILGKPVVITNYPTAKSQVEDGINGYICGLEPKEIADGVEYVYNNISLRKELINNCKRSDFSNKKELEKLYKVL